MSACRTMPGCFHDVSRELVWVGGEASPFPLARPGCLAFQHATVNLFPGRQPLTLIPCQMKGCRPQLPMSHFVISGNKWTSPKSTGRSCIFLLPSGSWEVRRWVFQVEIVRHLIMSALPLCWLMGEAKHALAVHVTRLARQMEDFLRTQLHATTCVICWSARADCLRTQWQHGSLHPQTPRFQSNNHESNSGKITKLSLCLCARLSWVH